MLTSVQYRNCGEMKVENEYVVAANQKAGRDLSDALLATSWRMPMKSLCIGHQRSPGTGAALTFAPKKSPISMKLDPATRVTDRH